MYSWDNVENIIIDFFFFFFSSRRRHTRLQGDWSSDVCSSDLRIQGTALDPLALLDLARLCERAMDARAAILAERESAPTLFEIVAGVSAELKDRKSVV